MSAPTYEPLPEAPPRYFDKWAVLDSPQVAFKPHKGQLIVAESTARHRVVSAGRRFGKSYVGGHELVAEALFTRTQERRLTEEMKRREFWIVGPEYSDAEKEFRVLYNVLKRLQVPFDRPGTYNNPEGGMMSISLWNGTFQVHAKSSKYPDSLVGEGLSGVIMAEAAKQKPSVWTKYISPTLSDFKGWSLHSSTPEGKNHFYEKWKWGQDRGMSQWESWRMPAWVNHYVYRQPTRAADVKQLQELMLHEHLATDLAQRALDTEIYGNDRLMALVRKYGLKVDEEIMGQLASMTQEAFNQEIGADFTDFVGRVFGDFDSEYHVAELPFQSGWKTYAAVDYGFTNPNVWLLIQVGPRYEINVIDEIYEPGLDADQFADLILARNLCPSGLIRFYPDPSSPGDSAILTRKLRKEAATGTGGDLKDRIDAIRLSLRTDSAAHMWRGHPDRRPQLMFDRKCVKTINDMEEYRYPDAKEQNSTAAQENPMKKDDHGPEALGRFFRGFFGTPQESAQRTRVSKGKFKR